MKKQAMIIIVIMIVTSLILSACSGNQTSDTSTRKEEIATETPKNGQEEPKAEIGKGTDAKQKTEEENKESDEGIQNEYLSYLGKTDEEIIDILGEPTLRDYSDDNGQYIISYEEERIKFYLDELNEKLVATTVVFRGNEKIYNVENGMSTKEVIQVLGIPEDAGEEEVTGLYTMYYQIDDNSVSLTTEGGKDGNIDFITVTSTSLLDQVFAQYEEQQTTEYIAETSSGLRLLDFTPTQDDYGKYVEGIISNPTNSDIKMVDVSFIVWDSEGNQIEEVSDYTSVIKANSKWKFKAIVIEDGAARVELNDITSW